MLWFHGLVVAVLLGMVMAGCWDYRELEDRALIVGLGIDELPPARYQGKEMRMYQLIVQVVEPTGQSGGPTQGGMIGRGQGTKGYTNFTIETPSIAEGIDRIITRSDRIPNLAHLQLIGMGEKVAKKGFNELYDFFTRFPQMRRKTEMVVFSGSLPPFFTTQSITEPTPALHIAQLTDSVTETLMIPDTNLGVVSKNIRGKTPYLMLLVALDDKKEIVINRAAVFEGFKMVGTLSRSQLTDLSILHDEIQRGILHFPCYGGKQAALQVLRGKTRLKPDMRGNTPHVTFDIQMETELVEYQCLGAAMDKPENIKRLERSYSAILSRRLQRTMEELVKKYHSDLFRLTTRLKKDPAMYREIRQRPKEFFQRLTFDMRVSLKIRNLGNTLETPSRSLRP
ncbi:Ger(x)C family spore germination protein [Brevibacillus sp. SYP-B805]|uniref:Ger(x)C family spore germination protein n=1 Tax=Brevibacillus sp. SYP-B805 TaxID=1578199 RepID=UPI0013ED70E5|nr:Ger(x)C family spore germination protein [Brevibacillus sp. SYP-B805]NGQ94399.1 Ger(x)C family spore germination protein [Brevibacillus sp. SYP-B805]